jgi:hypothetical protein
MGEEGIGTSSRVGKDNRISRYRGTPMGYLAICRALVKGLSAKRRDGVRTSATERSDPVPHRPHSLPTCHLPWYCITSKAHLIPEVPAEDTSIESTTRVERLTWTHSGIV